MQNTSIASTLVGMHTPELVEANVATAKEALGVVVCDNLAAEQMTLQAIETILKPVLNMSWPSGK